MNLLFQKKIAILILQHLSNAPRAQKEAAALARAGAEVTVLGSWWSDKLSEEDVEIAEKLHITFVPLVDLRPGAAGSFMPRLKGRIAKELFRHFNLVIPETYGVTARKMMSMVRQMKPHLTMVHCEPGLWAGCRLLDEGFCVGVDFEDWFSEDLLPEARLHRPVRAIAAAEKRLLGRAAVRFATTRSMALALQQWANVDTTPLVIPNAFRRTDAPGQDSGLDRRSPDAVSFHWFSQTIGPGRGLETLAAALSGLQGNWELHLRGQIKGMEVWLEQTFSPRLQEQITIHPLVSNEQLPRHCASHDVGLALEIPYCNNKDLTASNKIFEYMRCGLAIIATDTKGQQEVMAGCPGSGWVVPANDADRLRSVMQRCIDKSDSVAAAKAEARRASATSWAWEAFEPLLVQEVVGALQIDCKK